MRAACQISDSLIYLKKSIHNFNNTIELCLLDHGLQKPWRLLETGVYSRPSVY